jgi:hypothetical protein
MLPVFDRAASVERTPLDAAIAAVGQHAQLVSVARMAFLLHEK